MRLAQSTGITGITSKSPIFTNNNPDLLALLVSRILLFAVAGAGIYFFLRLIIAGYIYLTSVGDPSRVQSASRTLTTATTGFLVVLCALSIMYILQTVFGLTIL